MDFLFYNNQVSQLNYFIRLHIKEFFMLFFTIINFKFQILVNHIFIVMFNHNVLFLNQIKYMLFYLIKFEMQILMLLKIFNHALIFHEN